MWVLDLDLDFFLDNCCPLAPKGERPSSSCASPWTEREVVSFLENGLGLDTAHPIPGRITETHDGALAFWKERMDAGRLDKPFSVVHVDAHADLGIGKPGPGFVLNNVLGIPPKERDDISRYYAQKQDRYADACARSVFPPGPAAVLRAGGGGLSTDPAGILRVQAV